MLGHDVLRKNTFKGSLSLVFFLFAAVLFASHSTDSLYPWIGLGILTSILLVIFEWVRDVDRDQIQYLIILILVSAGYRIYTYLFPASMIGIDSDSYAFQTQQLINTGSTSVVSSGFYSDAPLIFVQTAVVGIVSELTTPVAMSIYPFFIGGLFPISAYIIARKSNFERASWIAVPAASIAGIGTVSFRLSFWPIAQTLATAQWVVLLMIIAGYLINRDHRFVSPALLVSVSIIFTHRLPSVMVVAVLFLLLGLLAMRDIQSRIFGRNIKSYMSLSPIVILLLLFGIFVYLQLFTITGYGSSLLYKIGLLSQKGSSSALYQAPDSYSQATAVGAGLWGMIVRRGHGLILLPLSGLAWIAVFSKRWKINHVFVLSVTAATTFFMVLGLTDPDVGILSRYLFLAEPFFAVLVAIGFLKVIPTFRDVKRRQQFIFIGKFVIVVIIISQGISVTAALPDHPNDSRIYLTDAEIAGKDFAHRYANGNISLDDFYASMFTPRMIRKTKKQTKINVYNQSAMFMGRENFFDTKYLLIRPDVNIYRTSNGPYQLLWNPKRHLARRTDKVYSNKKSMLFKAG